MNTNIAILDLSQDREFSNNVAKLLNTEPFSIDMKKLKDGETSLTIRENVKGKDVYIFQNYTPPIGERLYELLSAVNAAHEAKSITAVMPYCFGMRGEKQTEPQRAISAAVVAHSLKAMGVSNVITIGLHSAAVERIFAEAGITIAHLTFNNLAASFVINAASQENNHTIVIASPDAGGAQRVRETKDIIANSSGLAASLAIGEKRRPEADKTEILGITGEVKGKTVFLYDDIGDTLGTIHGAVQAIKKRDAKETYLLMIHPVLGQGFEPRLQDLCDDPFVKEIVFGNTIPLKSIAKTYRKIRTIPLEPLFAEAIRKASTLISSRSAHEQQYT